MTSHQVQQVIDIHFIRLIGLSELDKIHVLSVLLDDLAQGKVLNEEVIQGICLRQLQLLVDVLGQRPQDALEILHAHNLIFVIHHEKLGIIDILLLGILEKVP